MTILYVPTPYSSISDALAIATSGDTISVAAGTYNEQITINVPNITLLGVQVNVDARTRGYIAGNESIITYTPDAGNGIVNIKATGFIINGFTIQGTITDSTSAIFAGDAGQFPAGTSSINVTGLQILNNIIQSNGSGILIASYEQSQDMPNSPNPPNYLVQYNYFYNNSGDYGSGNGLGVLFNNSNSIDDVPIVMTNVLVTQNLFNGLETNSSVNLTNVNTATVSNNVMNNDNRIALYGASNVTIDGNVSYGATGIIPNDDTNTADAIFIGFSCTNIIISNNLIFNATNNGIDIYNGNSNITIRNNCIEANAWAGIAVDNGEGSANSVIVVNSNNFESNNPGLLLNSGSYTDTASSFNATLNYWNSSSGPNYNNKGPGSGDADAITDNNDDSFQTVNYSSFLTTPISCPSPVTLTKTSSSINVVPGTPLNFQISFTVAPNSVPFEVTSFTDSLPSLAGGSPWTITAQSPSDPEFFTLTGDTGSQTVGISDSFPIPIQSPTSLPSGTYSVTLSANTNMNDVSSILPNTASMEIQIIAGDPGISQVLSASATASVDACIHGSSMIKLSNGKELEISKLKPGQQILGADGEITEIIEAIPCWLKVDNKLFGNCIIFEPDSLGDGIPSTLFAVDPGHPICTPDEYAKNGAKSLRPAKSYVNKTKRVGKYIYQMTWEATALLLPGDNRRFDLIMKDDSCKAYIANGIVVKARQGRKITGYEYE